MLTVTKPKPDRLDLTLSGTLDAVAMEAGLEALMEASEGIKHGRMLYRIDEFNMPTLGGLGVELRFLPSLIALCSRFDRCAVISDQPWLRTAAEVEGALIPGMEIRAYAPEEAGDAELWLAEEEM